MQCVAWFKSHWMFILLFNLSFFQSQPWCINSSPPLSGQVHLNTQRRKILSFFIYDFKSSVLKVNWTSENFGKKYFSYWTYEKVTALSPASEFLTLCSWKCGSGQCSSSWWSCASVNEGNYSNHVCKLHERFTHLLKPKSWKFIPISLICQGWSSVIHNFNTINNEEL